MSTRYKLDPEFNIYVKAGAARFNYSDGDAVENFLYATIKGASDVSSGSEELQRYISNWPTLYHLSPARANLFRPIEASLRGKKVLELGSGCGAISRFLGETGCELTCVEGSLRRAGITAARCRDLPNVKVYNDNFQDFEADGLFDVVTLIGVLEYSRKFIGGDDPVGAALALARSFLKPDGVLLIAIENKLGLKYWAGAYEDHQGIPFYGIESLYGEGEAVTFGRRDLARVLQKAEFGDLEYFYPYPDYKLPTMVLTEHALEQEPEVLLNLLSGVFAPNQSATYQRVFSEGAAYRGLVENGLVGDLANSFFIVAKKGQGNWVSDNQAVAFTYSNGRRRGLNKEVSIHGVAGQLQVRRRRIATNADKPHWMQFADSEALSSGELLFNSLLPIINREGWGIESLAQWLRPLSHLLFSKAKTVAGRQVLPGEYFDATPFNLLIDANGNSCFFDLEWRLWPEVEVALPLFRGLFHCLARIGTVARPANDTPLGLAELAARVVAQLTGQRVDLDAYLAREVEFLQQVQLFAGNVEGLQASQLEIRYSPTHLRQALAKLKNELAHAQPAPTAVPGQIKLVEAQQAPGFIDNWLANRLPTEHENQLISGYLQNHAGGPVLGVVVLDLEGDTSKLMATIKSLGLERGLYATLKIIALTPAAVPQTSAADKLHFCQIDPEDYVPVLNQLISAADVEWFMLVSAGEEFTPSGLMMAALHLTRQPDCKALFADEMHRDAQGVLGTALRPGVNLDYLLSLPLAMARHWLFSRQLFVELGGYTQEYAGALEFDLLLRLIERDGIDGMAHVAEPLVIYDAPRIQDNPDEQATLLRHLQVRGYNASLVAGAPGRYRVNYGHAAQPLVSIIIPTKDQLPMVQRCVESLLELTQYPNYEVLIVDNNSETSQAQHWLQGIVEMGEANLRVLRYPHPFNYSAINNMAAKEARGEYLVLLNNDTAIIDGAWLNELLNHAQRPEVGVVGAKLLYPDGSIQHAGVVLGLRGPADHPFIGEPAEAAGYMQRMQVVQNYTAVTAACLMIRREVYEQVGGLDEQAFKVSYNDVDLCLKVRQAGYLTVWTPYAQLLHEGSVSQTHVDKATAEIKRKRFIGEQDEMYERWLPLLARDPAYNPNFSLNGKGFEVEPDIKLTWRPLTWQPLPVVLAHPADPHGCGNYRIILPFNAQKEAGLIDGMLSPGLLQVIDLERYDPDVIVLQRQIGDERLEAMRRIKKFSRAFKVYELDDYLPNLPMKSMHREHMPKDVLKSLRKGLGFVDRFVVSTERLADAFSGLHEQIQVVENRLAPQWWQGLTSKRGRGRKPRVGWAGGGSHTGDLELIADVVKALANEVEWVFFGMCPAKLRPYVYEFHAGVDIAQYPAALASMDLDLALAPVEQNLFNECKSNLRLLEYGVCGFPVICSDLVCYKGDLPVTRVKNRFKDWVDAIRAHISDLDASAKLGDELRARVHKDWMLDEANAKAWMQAWSAG
ncbi:glycosyltransferase [Pseudomonas sp. 5P_3.1_Bac2]|uniref:glycosyltransferase n=1 Tax=Pseudomonas sp. 5P_3.1_Bac2 TaxID=2971617 RepID=UPI0021C60DB5|nr:glycosyltransferase [Pseudomonas sp. 5P_3.1_Bac2]MCU1716483.1 glycosyltransferase [Pseudomonas sp. 5P_3.1_Bac2]